MDSYPLGRAIWQDSPSADVDWTFRTYVSSEPTVGGIVTPIDMIEVLSPWISLAGLVGVVATATPKRRELGIRGRS